MSTVLRRGHFEYVFRSPRPGRAREGMKFENDEAARKLIRLLVHDRHNRAQLRALLRRASPVAVVAPPTNDEIVERVAALLTSRRFIVVRRRIPAPVVAVPAPTPAPPPAPAPPPKPARVPLSDLKVIDLTFKTDHDKLKDDDKDWKNEGKRFPKPEWTSGANHPVSHTMEKEIQVEVTIEVGPAAGEAQQGKLIGSGPEYFTFEKEFFVAPGKSKHLLKSKGKLPKEIRKLQQSIAWGIQVAVDGSIGGNGTGAHTLYVTYDTPRDEGKQEDGATVKRMEKAVEWVGATGTLEPEEMIAQLFTRFPAYILNFRMLPEERKEELRKDPALQKKIEDDGFAAYDLSGSKKIGGAWLLAENERFGGECQAIVRLLRGMLYQVGVPGRVDVMYCNADASEPYRPRMRNWGSSPTGPNAGSRYTLMDGPVEEGKYVDEFPDAHANNYEAYLEFEYKGTISLFGGGIGKLSPTQNPVSVFFGLIEYERVFDAGTGGLRSKIVKLWQYRASAGGLTSDVKAFTDRSTWKIELR